MKKYTDDRPVIEILAEAGFTVGDKRNPTRTKRNIISPSGEDLGFHSPLEALELIKTKN